MLTPLQKQVHSKINELEAKVASTWGKDKIPTNFKVTFTLNSTNALGVVRNTTKGKHMELNPKLLEEFGEVYINEVVVHEYAHLVVMALFPNGYNGCKRVNSHGREFKAVCSHFGIVGKSTTSLFSKSQTIKSSTRKTMRYECNCKGDNVHMVTPQMHQKIQKWSGAQCKLCKTKIVYSPIEAVVA